MRHYIMNTIRKIWQFLSTQLTPWFAGAIFILIILLLLFIFPGWEGYDSSLIKILVPEGHEEDRETVIKYLGFAISGLAIFWGIYVANRRAGAMEEGNRQTVFRDALTHLGSVSVVTRGAGVYTLHSLARREESMRPVIGETLLAHIRVETQESEYQEKNKSRPSSDIQLLLDFLFRSKERFLFETQSVDLRQAYLQGANLMKAQLQGADLNGAQLQGARLSRAQLQRADLKGAQLQGAYLSRAKLQGAHLREAQFQGAFLNGAKLQGARLREAQFQEAFLIGARLQGAYLSGAKLQGAYLIEAKLQGANLSGAKLQGADLRKAQLQGAFSEPFRSGFVPFERQIHNRIGEESALSGVVFSDGLTQEEVDKVEGSDDLKERLQPHVGKAANHELPEDSGAITGKYTQEDANKWTAEYREAFEENNSADPDTIS